MAGNGDERTSTAVEAFELLANDRRMAIMETLWEQREPMPFSDLREAVGIADSGQFNYHLGKLVGLYVVDTDDGYELTRPGRRVLSAVLAGDLLDRPEIDPVVVDWPCPRCAADVELRYDDEMLRVLCTECPGMFQGVAQSRRERRENPMGTISILPIPPAGTEGRTPRELLTAAIQWISQRAIVASTGMCPECSGSLAVDVHVCPDHAPGDGLCETCGSWHAGIADVTCQTCGDGITTLLGAMVWNHARVRVFFAEHGLDITEVNPDTVRVSVGYEETVHARDPLDVELRWTVDDETLAVRVDGELEVTSVDRAGG